MMSRISKGFGVAVVGVLADVPGKISRSAVNGTRIVRS